MKNIILKEGKEKKIREIKKKAEKLLKS